MGILSFRGAFLQKGSLKSQALKTALELGVTELHEKSAQGAGFTCLFPPSLPKLAADSTFQAFPGTNRCVRFQDYVPF